MARTRDLPRRGGQGRRSAGEYWELSRRLLSSAFRGKPIREFLSDVGREFLDFTGSNECETRVRSRGDEFRHVCRRDASPPERLSVWAGRAAGPSPTDNPRSDFELICDELLAPSPDASFPRKAAGGSLVVGDSNRLLRPEKAGPDGAGRAYDLSGDHRSLLFLPFGEDREEETDRGLVVLKSRRGNFYRTEEIAHLEEVARNLELAFADRRTHLSLRERVKELTCLYQIALLVEQPRASLAEILPGIVEILPEAWLYPASAGSSRSGLLRGEAGPG